MTKLVVKDNHERGNPAAEVNFTLCQLSEGRPTSEIINVMNSRKDAHPPFFTGFTKNK